ncbi:MAG: ATP-dependent DNA helicase [Putridiphycobacter sp.]
MITKLSHTDFKSQFLKAFKFQPTQDQKTAISALSTFISNPNEFELFVLKGYAGTGKTTLISNLIQTLNTYNIKSVSLAPTGRAAKVLSTYSNEKANTIHRKIYFQNTTPEQGIYFNLGRNLHKNTLFLIDEASMIASYSSADQQRDLLNDVIEYVYSGDNCKLIFIGDEGQLPPVGLADSPALSPDFLKQSFSLDIVEIKLNEVVRQAEQSGILTLATQLREFTPTPPTLFYNQTDVKAINGMELQEELESAIHEYGQEEVMVITRSNKRANLFNQQIRHRILWQEEDLNAGDVLMVGKNNYFWVSSDSEIGFIANGEIIEILKVIRREELYGFEFADVLVRFIDYPQIPEVELKININAIRHEGANLPREILAELFYTIAREEYPLERNKKIRNKLVMTNPYFQALQVKFAYAVTCHKAQGGQWSTIFIDQGYFVDDMWSPEYMRWLYTAVTRAKEKLFLVNFSKPFVDLED